MIGMGLLFDALWRAAGYCLHPRVMLGSLLPLLAAGALASLAGWLYWENLVGSVRGLLEGSEWIAAALRWLDSVGATALHAMLAPLLVVVAAVPLVVLVALLLVAVTLTPAIVSLVARRRFPALERRQGGGWWQGIGWSLACTLAAMAALVLSVPLWFVPPLVLVLPPLIWGWLTTRIYTYDVLAQHASPAERRQIAHERRWPLLAIGVCCGYLGTLPSLLWTIGAGTLVFAPVLVVLSLWLYTLIFAFAACWFAHYALAELHRLRLAAAPPPAAADPPVPPTPPLLPA